MYRTVRIQVIGCGIISDVRQGRLLTGIIAWALGTALAVVVAWYGAEAVIHGTNGPVVPVVDSAATPNTGAGDGAPGRTPGSTPQPSASGSASASTGPGGVSPSGHPADPHGSDPAASSSPHAGSSASPNPALANDERSYALTGGHVTLKITSTSATLISATPDPGYTTERWSSMGWLRVDFDKNGKEISSLIADWYQQAPTVTIGH
jgi:hypothetical protein